MTEQAISPLLRRMIEDMTIRKFAQKTQHACWRTAVLSGGSPAPEAWERGRHRCGNSSGESCSTTLSALRAAQIPSTRPFALRRACVIKERLNRPV
jgi:integrase/recombinase XerD